ncbi:MAG: hypothetical protein AMXMBFR64_58540 [Myxococcales bacterium]
MKLTPVLAILCVAGVWSDWSDGNDAQAATANDDRVFHVEHAGRIYTKLVAINSTATWRFRTSGATGGLDTVLHVWNRSTGAWIRSNDDVAGGNCTDLFPTSELTSCRDISLTSGTTVIVFVHRRSNATTGTCLFEAGVKNGTPVVSETIEPGGDITRRWTITDPIEWDEGDKLQLAYTAVRPLPNQDIWTHGMLLPGVLALAGTEKLYGYALSGTAPFGDPSIDPGIWGQPALPLAASSSSITPYPSGTFAFGYVVGHSYWDTSLYGNGTVTLYRNDVAISGRDPDHDYLGTELEMALGTCWEDTECPDGNPKDTDGDGLRDDWETIGGCTFYGCEAHTSDAINLAYYGGDPLVQNGFFQVDWPQIGDQEVDAFGRLAPALAQIAAAYGREMASTGASKSPIKLFFDYGQLAQGGTGGNIGPENPNFCIAMEPHRECTALTAFPCEAEPIVDPPPGTCVGNCGANDSEAECWCDAACHYMGDCCDDVCDECSENCEFDVCLDGYTCQSLGEGQPDACLPTSSCTGMNCSSGNVCKEMFDGGPTVCVPEGLCETPCAADPTVHLDHVGEGATLTPYNLQHVMRGDPSQPYAFVPRNRRGVFGEVWLQNQFPGEGATSMGETMFADYSSCCLLGQGCDNPYPGCKDLFPGWVALHQPWVAFGASWGDERYFRVRAFHELGHIFGLLHGWIEQDAQAECTFDYECTGDFGVCRGGLCTRGVWDVVNFISVMSYEFTGPDGIDLQGKWDASYLPTLDYSSGVHQTVQGFTDRGVSCEDSECPDKDDAECPIPVLDWVEGDKCCLEGVCVVGALSENDGIGDTFGLDVDPGDHDEAYIDNRTFQLFWAGYCIRNHQGYPGAPYYPGEWGPVPLDINEATHHIDWNENHDLDEDPVGAFLFWKDHWDEQIGYWQGCGPWHAESNPTVLGQSNVKPYRDTDEWNFMSLRGFRHFGLNQQPEMVFSPVCGEDEDIDCPSGFDCEYGRCTVSQEGYLPRGFPPPEP